MSASRPQENSLINPAAKFIKWKGGSDQGFAEYYDKSSKTSHTIELKDFFILDRDLFSIKGYSERQKGSYISNAIRPNTDDIITIKFYEKEQAPKVIARGTYAEVKEKIGGDRDMKYTREMYILLDGEVCHLSLNGASFSEWIKIESDARHSNHSISISGTEQRKKGSVKFVVPVFTIGNKATDEEWAEVVKADSEIIQPFLDKYMKKGQSGSESLPSSDGGGSISSGWREYKAPSGVAIGAMTAEAIQNEYDSLVELGEISNPFFNNLVRALHEIENSDWKNKEDKNGKNLGEYTLTEIEELLTKVPSNNKYRVYLMAAQEDLRDKSSGASYEEEEEDDIPF